MNISTENGIQMTLEMWMPEASPKSIVSASEHHVRTFPLPDSEKALKETDHPSLEKYLESLGKRGKKIDPNGLSMKTLRECFRQIGGVTSSQYSWKWTNWGMTQNGRFSTQKIGECRKTGSVCILLDILEPKAEKKYFLSAQQMEKIIFKSDRSDRSKPEETIPRDTESIQKGGVSPCLNTMGGGGLEPHIPVVVGGVGEMKSNNGTQHYQQDRIYDPDGVSPALSSNLPGGGNMITVKASQQGIGGGTEASHTLMARDYKGIGNQEMTAVILKCSESTTTLGDRSEISQTQSRQNMMLGLQTSDRTGQRYV